MRIGSLCSGYGGLTLAVQAVLGGRVAWHSEYEPPTEKNPKPSQAAARLLEYRFPGVPNIGDMTAVDWSSVEPVDVLEGGTPCQDVSHGGKRAGMRAGTRSGLWSSMVDAIDVLRPRLVVWENVRGVLSAEADSGMEPCALCVGDGTGPALRALGRVLGDLADLGYDARWCGLRAADVGAPHGRFRTFVAAWDATRDDLGHDAVESSRGARGTQAAARGADSPAADPANVGHERGGHAWGGWPGPAYDSEPAADAERSGRNGWTPDPRRGTLERATAAGRGAIAVADADEPGPQGPQPARRRHMPDGRAAAEWGPYRPAVERWEYVTGRPAPAPTEPGRTGQRLSPRFVEWMMGLPAGWVADVPGTTRNDQLKMLGNGVVPQQAQAALEHMLAAS